MQKSKMAVRENLTNSCEKKGCKNKGEKERYTHLNASSKELQEEIRKPSSVIRAEK